MRKKNISISLDANLLERIDACAESRHISRSSVINLMLNNTHVIIIKEGAELLTHLCSIDTLLKKKWLSYEEIAKTERVCKDIWQLLGLITEKIPRQIQKETN